MTVLDARVTGMQDCRMRRFVRAIILAAALPLPCAAQAPAPAPAPRTNVSLGLGIHYGSPLRGSAAVGILADMRGKRNDGVIAMFEPGQHGIELSAGYFRMLGRFGSGYSLRGAFVRTRDDPWNASPNANYAGVEAHWMLVFGVGARVGYLRRIGGMADALHDNLASIGLSIGA